uniref:Uncharacterized protein n=1 Tax=Paramormyrops kingsleyae TaxID=1676925 RepID=A0A3B3T8Z3_9TELE
MMAAPSKAAATPVPVSYVRFMLNVMYSSSQSNSRLVYDRCTLLELRESTRSSNISTSLPALELKTLRKRLQELYRFIRSLFLTSLNNSLFFN